MMMDEFIELPGSYDDSLECFLCRDSDEYGLYRGSMVKSRGLKENGAGEYEETSNDFYDDFWYEEVWWLTKRTELTRERTDFVAYGNNAELAHTYGDVILIAKVGGHANRAKQSDSELWVRTLVQLFCFTNNIIIMNGKVSPCPIFRERRS